MRDASWRLAVVLAVGLGVGFSVLLMSCAYGVGAQISRSVSNPLLKQSHLVDTARIDAILVSLTAVIIGSMLIETAAATFVLGVTVMRMRREEIALRRQSGVLRSTLLREFAVSMMMACAIGGVLGEAVGISAAELLSRVTVLPIQFTPVSLLAAFPVTVALALAATLLPAWRAANASPALLRRE